MQYIIYNSALITLSIKLLLLFLCYFIFIAYEVKEVISASSSMCFHTMGKIYAKQCRFLTSCIQDCGKLINMEVMTKFMGVFWQM